MALDPEDLYAFSRNLVLAASAGTGKTHALVGIIVELLMTDRASEGRKRQPLDPSRIVATTFSRKAAAEIRGRVAAELERLSGEPSSSPYAAGLRRRSGLRDDALRRRARAALVRLPRARFGTLHSFATGLVRSYAVELELGPGFELATEADARARTEEAISRALEEELETNPEALRALAEAAGGLDRLVTSLRRVLVQLEEDGRSARELDVSTDDAAAVEATATRFVAHARDLIRVPKFEAAARDVEAAWSAADESGLENAMAALSAVAATGKKTPEVEAFAVFRKELPGATNEEKGRRLARTFHARHLFTEYGSLARKLLSSAESRVAAAGRARAALGFGEVLRAARDLLRARPDIAAEAGAEVDALLVDEFQDTSRVQRDLLQLLWARPEAREQGVIPALTAIRGTGLLVVGDRKQSIYGFRGADVSIFAELAIGLAGMPAREALGIPPGMAWEPAQPTADFWALRHNRRSVPSILTFANAFSARRFAPERPPELFEIDYVAATEDLLVPPERSPRADDAAPRTTWLRISSPKGTTSSRIEEALVIARSVRALVGNEASQTAWRDVAVLATTNGMLDAAAFALAQSDIPYVVAGKSFFRAREVRDLAAMLSLALDPNDRQAALAVLRGPWAAVHDETLLALTESGKGLVPPHRWTTPPMPHLVKLGDEERLAEVSRLVQQLARVAPRLGPASVLREAVLGLSLESVLLALPRGRQRVANVRKLLAIADRHHDPHAFRRWLDDASEQEVGETEAATFSDEDDAVRLLTVHASKGLDFPVVFIPEIAAGLPRSDRGVARVTVGTGAAPNRLSVRVADAQGFVLDPPSYLASHLVGRRRERAERQRLAYVAVTRAARSLYFVGGRTKSGTVDAGSSTLATLEDLATVAADVGLVVEDVTVPAPFFGRAEAPVEISVAESPTAERLPIPSWRTLPIAPTALADFARCARRFQLIHLLGLPERPRGRLGDRPRARAGALDARARGTLAHAILERVPLAAFNGPNAVDEASRILVTEGIPLDDPEHLAIVSRVEQFLTGEYAKQLSGEGVDVRREVPFVLAIEDRSGREVVLRGSIDLLVKWPDGTVDVVDYKSARGGDPDAYAFQLDVYVLAARAMYGVAPRIRAGLVFLGGKSAEPTWRVATDEATFRASLAVLGQTLVTARWTAAFPRVELGRCEAIYCGFIGRCHATSPEANGTNANESRETTR